MMENTSTALEIAKKRKKSERPAAYFMLIAMAATIWLSAHGAYASQSAANQAQGAKTQRTVNAEHELEWLSAREKQIRGQITEATINRSKLLSQKRGELRQARAKRDESINAEIAGAKERKNRQTILIAEMKKQLAQAKRDKNSGEISTLEVLLRLADIRLVDINEDIKKANARLSQSYALYKSAYDRLTELDAQMKKRLDANAETESAIKRQKESLRTKKNEYSASIRKKDFHAAERAMDALVSIQTAINANYERILDVKRNVKDDYHEMIMQYRA